MSKAAEKLDLATRAAWLYYVAGNTQSEIARKLGVSRPVAQRLVAMAVDKNLVRVHIDHPLASCLTLAKALSERYGLSLCEVVPFDRDQPDALDRKLAVAGAQVMRRFLDVHTPSVVAIGSGRTLKAAVRQLPQVKRPQHRLVSMVGAIAPDGSSNPYDIAQQLGEKTGGKYFLVPAPMFADNASERAQWCHHRLYRAVEALWQQADVAFIGIGNIGPKCPLREDGFITAAELDALTSAGAAAELLGLPIGRDGKEMDASLRRRATSARLRSPTKQSVIGFAGGTRKREAIGAALRGGWLSGLVTDEACARAALDQR